MRSTSKMTLAALFGVLAVCAIASASASAAACVEKAGSKNYQLCIAGQSLNEVTSVPASAQLTGAFVLELPAEEESSIRCTAATQTAQFNVQGLTKSVGLRFEVMSLSGCKLEGALAKKCSVNTTLHTDGNQPGKFESPGLVVMGEAGQEFTQFETKNNPSGCPGVLTSKTIIVRGTYECKLASATVQAVEHELSCATSATHKLESQIGKFTLHYTQALSLSGTHAGQKFSIYEG
jgi:hypothetical protein